jgi:hypothetical protein
VGSVYSGELELEYITLHSHVDFQLDVDRSYLASFDCGASAEKAGGKNRHMTPQETKRVINLIFIKASFEVLCGTSFRNREGVVPMSE